MNVSVYGAGYVGLVAAACLAESGNRVIAFDINASKIVALQRGSVPIFEPGLSELLQRNQAEGRLSFTTDVRQAVTSSLIQIIAVGTPPALDAAADPEAVLDVGRAIGRHMESAKIIISKSTVPVGTAVQLRDILQAELTARRVVLDFDVVSNPEFLKEGAAIEDFTKPDRVILGTDSLRPVDILRELYAPFLRQQNRLIVMDSRSAEMTKYAANAMLATRISFMNQIAGLCGKLGADVAAVREGIGSDSRIGPEFLVPGPGYGGSCLPKDVRALIRTAEEHDYDLTLLKAVDTVNVRQRHLLADKVIAALGTADTGRPLAGRTIACWGLSYKPGTDDMRESPALTIVERLLGAGAMVRAHDPESLDEARKIFRDRIACIPDTYEVLDGADALVVITDWPEYRSPDFARMKEALRSPLVVDGRNLYRPAHMSRQGFSYLHL